MHGTSSPIPCAVGLVGSSTRFSQHCLSQKCAFASFDSSTEQCTQTLQPAVAKHILQHSALVSTLFYGVEATTTSPQYSALGLKSSHVGWETSKDGSEIVFPSSRPPRFRGSKSLVNSTCRVSFVRVGENFTRINRFSLDQIVCVTGQVVHLEHRPGANLRPYSIALVAFHAEPGLVFQVVWEKSPMTE